MKVGDKILIIKNTSITSLYDVKLPQISKIKGIYNGKYGELYLCKIEILDAIMNFSYIDRKILKDDFIKLNSLLEILF